MKRNIISIDESLCNGCGACVDGCHEGALQLIDGKARIVSELYCDGLGACIGECPVGAITIEERESEPYSEIAVMERIFPKGEKVVTAHLKHLKEHGEKDYLTQGIAYANAHGMNIEASLQELEAPKMACGCPGSMERSFVAPTPFVPVGGSAASQLTHWPVQLHLQNPLAGHFAGTDILLAADCTAFAYPDFHNRFLSGKKLSIACPKLDSNKESYVEKLVEMIDSSQINTLTVAIMEVPCCGGLVHIAKMAAEKAQRKVPIKKIVVGIKGNIIDESWI